MKENDWLVAGLMNPDFSTNDFAISGLNPDNTQLLPLEQYKNSSFIKDKFTEDGVFKEQKLEDFYKNRVQEFGKLQSISSNDSQNTFLYSPFDTRNTDRSKTLSPNYSIDIVANPNRDTDILGNIQHNTLSTRELAQQSKIWDSEKGEWKNETVNDRAFFSNPLKWLKTVFQDPLVYATYDSDGWHYDTFSGQMVEHKKGQYKLNKYGLPYTETLNGRSVSNKEVVSGFDVLTVDNQGLNKYDFFDSDGLDKSITGTIMKSAAAIAPMLMGPYIAPIYSGLLVGREILKTLPMLYGISTSWSDAPQENATLNKLAGIGQSLTTGISDAGKSSMLNAEQLSSMISDIALQWGQQKAIANSINKLRGVNNLANDAYIKAGKDYATAKLVLEQKAKKGLITKEALEKYVGDASQWQESIIGKSAIKKYMKDVEPSLERSRRLGADASLVYMALVSNTDVYQSMLDAGASRKEAAAVALGSTVGMFSVDRFLGLGELFFDDLTSEAQRSIRSTLTKESKNWYNNVVKQGVQETTSNVNKFRKLFQSGVDWGKKKTNKFIDDLKYHSTGFVGKGIGEGLEEVGEEFVSDLSKGLYELSSDLGFNTTVQDVGAFDNWKERYGMSFLGGALGGSLFYGVNLYQTGKFDIDQTQDELIYLVRNGKTQDVLKTLDKWRDQGKFGSKSLSVKTTKDNQGNDVFLTAENEQDSQNNFIYNRIKETVLQLQNIINENDANLTDDELYDNMILSEARFRDLQKYLQGQSYATGYQQDYQNILNNIINIQAAIKKANQTKTGIPYQSEDEYNKNLASDEYLRNMPEQERKLRDRNLKKLDDQLKNAQDELNRFLSGEYSMDYTEKMLFYLDENLNQNFTTTTYEQWLKNTHDGKTFSDLSPDEMVKYKQEYLQYKSKAQKQNLTKAYELYKSIKEQVDPVLLELQNNSDKYTKSSQELLNLVNSEAIQVSPYNMDSVLDMYGETEDSDTYKNRNNPENQEQRKELVKQANIEYYKQLKDIILDIINKSGGNISPIIRRQLKLQLQSRNKDILKQLQKELEGEIILNNLEVDSESGQIIHKGELSELDKSILQLLENIDINQENSDKIWDQIKSLIESEFKEPIKKQNELYGKIRTYIDQASEGIGYYFNPNEDELTGKALFDMINKKVQEGLTVDEVFDLNNTELYPEIDDIISRAELSAFINDLRLKYKQETRKENPVTGALSRTTKYLTRNMSKALDENQEVQKELSYYNSLYRKYLDNIKSNPIINLNKELDSKIANNNITANLIKGLALHLNVNMENLEKILDNLDKHYESVEDIHDLILSSDEKESFQEAAEIIKLVQAYLYAASNTPNIINPFGHNAFLNYFAEKHKDIYKDFRALPTLSSDLYDSINSELDLYLQQMGIQDPKTKQYNIGSWMYLSNANEIDKAAQFVRAEKAWNKACYDTFVVHQESFKFEYNGTQYNLLEGIESIPEVTSDTPDALIYVTKIFNLFYNNVNSLIKQGWTYKQILERSQLLDKMLKLNLVAQQKTASLDQNISESNMSHYDKAILIATAASMDSTKFYSYLRERIQEEDNIVPLTIQEWLSRVGIAELENSDFYNDTLEYIKEKTNDPRPILYNTAYMGGNAGAGKSRVVARNIAKYAKNKVIWLSAPKESQINTLFESVSKGIKMLNRKNPKNPDIPEIFEQIGINYDVYKATSDILSDQEVLSKLANGQAPQSDNFTITETDEAYVININPDKFGIKKIQNAPAVIIIDEATHLSNLDLQILSQFAKINDSKLILLGDGKQKGWDGLGKNIDREQCFVVRTPNLGISLRDDNVQHQFNLHTLEDLINQLSNLDIENPDYNKQVQAIRELLKNIQFKVYNQDEINGEQILNSLTDSYVNKLHGKIGYVGREPSATLDSLKKSNLDVEVLQEVDIQGQEFDYVVIDKDFNIPNSQTSAIGILNFLRDLYTMISRGRKGSIIIDPNDKLSKAIGKNRVEFVKAQAPKISEYADKFRQEKLDVLDKILGSKSSQETSENKQENDETQNQDKNQEDKSDNEYIPEIILDKDFDVNNLDFDNNYYIVQQIPFSASEVIQKSGIINAQELKNNSLFATKDLINQIIVSQKEGNGYNGYDAILVLQFPKDLFGTGINTLDPILSKIEETDNVQNTIPPKYVKSIIHTIPTELKDDTKTDPTDIIEKPVVTQDDIKDWNMDQDDLPLNPEDVDSDTFQNPILCFGQATFTGLKTEIRDGKQVWINTPTNNGAIKRDIQLFTNQQEIDSDEEQIALSRKIRKLKNAILYRRDFNDQPDYITKLFEPGKTFDDIKWYIQVSERNDQDHFIRNTRFEEDKMVISSKNLVFKVIGEMPLADKTKGYVTLGLLSDPKNWIDQIGKEGGIRDRIKKKIERFQSKLDGKLVLTESQKDNIQKYINHYKKQLENLNLDNPESDPIQYRNYIEKLANMYNGKDPILVPIKNMIRPGLTDLHRQKRSVRLSRLSKSLIRSAENRIKFLNDKLDALSKEPNTEDRAIKIYRLRDSIKRAQDKLQEFKDMKDVSFRSLNPYTVVSPMYIYTPASNISNSTGINSSVIGKCNVVFVTNEEGADPNTLVNKYIAQKKASEAEKQQNGVVDLKNSKIVPSVRMVVLDNLGVSFQDLSNPYLAEAMTGEVSYETKDGKKVAHKQIYPFKTNYTGLRMYVGLWNFRANLLNFKEKYDSFIKTLPIEEEQLDDYLRTKDLLWRQNNGRTLSKDELQYLDSHKNLDKFEEVSKLVDEFNDSLSNQVKEFRLGSDLTNGAYVRYLTGDTSSLYNTKEKVSGIYINSSTFHNYLALAESLFSNVLDQIITCNQSKKKLLSAKEGVRNSFSGYTKTIANANGVLEVTDYDEEKQEYIKDFIRFGSAFGAPGTMNSFSHIPAVLSKVFKYTSLRQTHISGKNFDTKNRYSIKITGTLEDEQGNKTKLDKVIPYYNIWRYVSMPNGVNDEDIQALDDYVWDNNFSNFFSFAFHGTLEDVSDPNVQRATDAFAPKGFFADPLSTTDRVYDGRNKMFTKAVQNQIFFGIDVTVGDPTFFISLKSLKESIDTLEKPKEADNNDLSIQQCLTIVQNVSTKYQKLEPQFKEVLNGIETIESSKRIEAIKSLIEDIIDQEVNSNFNALFDKTYNVATITPDMLVKKTSYDEAITLQMLLSQQYQQKYNDILPTITNISRDGNKLIVDAGDISIQVSKSLDGNISVSKIESPIIGDSIVITEVNNLLSTLDKVLKSQDKEHLQKNISDYQAVSEELKQQQKQTIIKTLKGFTRTYGTKREAFKLIRDVINKISEPNCI